MLSNLPLPLLISTFIKPVKKMIIYNPITPTFIPLKVALTFDANGTGILFATGSYSISVLKKTAFLDLFPLPPYNSNVNNFFRRIKSSI